MPTNADPLIAIKSLSAVIGSQGILHDIDLTVAQGDWLGLVGGSGAGKSTLFRALLGLKRPARPTSGTMVFAGKHYDLAAAKTERPQNIAFVPQSPAHGLDPLRQMEWQWSQLQRIQGQSPDTDYSDLFAALRLPPPDGRFPHQWSRGMQQRFLLAMALMASPKVLVLDEPTSALDAVVAARVLDEVQRIAAERNITVLMVTHDLSLAARFATTLAIMDHGRVVEQGPSEQLLSAPSHPYTQELVGHREWRKAPEMGWVRLC